MYVLAVVSSTTILYTPPSCIFVKVIVDPPTLAKVCELESDKSTAAPVAMGLVALAMALVAVITVPLSVIEEFPKEPEPVNFGMAFVVPVPETFPTEAHFKPEL